MKKILLVLISVLMLASCTRMWYYHGAKDALVNHPDIIPVWIDKNFNQGSRDDIENAMREWNFVLNGQIKFVRGESCDGPDGCLDYFKEAQKTGQGIVILNLAYNDENVPDELSTETLAAVHGAHAPVMFVIKDHLGQRNLKDIVLHEFGHTLGADHTVFPGLMYPIYGNKQYPCVDKITAMQVAHYNDLDIETLRYCKTPLFP